MTTMKKSVQALLDLLWAPPPVGDDPGNGLNADTVDGCHAGTGPNDVLRLDANGKAEANVTLYGGHYEPSNPLSAKAINADKLDGKHLSEIQQMWQTEISGGVGSITKVGLNVVAPNTDLPEPSAYTDGFYPIDAYSSPNAPGNYLTGFVIMRGNGTRGMQLLANWNAELGKCSQVFIRTKDDTQSTWGAWTYLLTESDAAALRTQWMSDIAQNSPTGGGAVAMGSASFKSDDDGLATTIDFTSELTDADSYMVVVTPSADTSANTGEYWVENISGSQFKVVNTGNGNTAFRWAVLSLG